MSVNDLLELNEMAAMLEATARKLCTREKRHGKEAHFEHRFELEDNRAHERGWRFPFIDRGCR
jgi:hypothetical protein